MRSIDDTHVKLKNVVTQTHLAMPAPLKPNQAHSNNTILFMTSTNGHICTCDHLSLSRVLSRVID